MWFVDDAMRRTSTALLKHQFSHFNILKSSYNLLQINNQYIIHYFSFVTPPKFMLLTSKMINIHTSKSRLPPPIMRRAETDRTTVHLKSRNLIKSERKGFWQPSVWHLTLSCSSTWAALSAVSLPVCRMSHWDSMRWESGWQLVVKFKKTAINY